MKLFALGRIVSAGSVYIGLAGKVAKFTEMAIITLRILSSVGSRDALRATLGASVQCCGRNCWTPACSQQSIFFCAPLVRVFRSMLYSTSSGVCAFLFYSSIIFYMHLVYVHSYVYDR